MTQLDHYTRTLFPDPYTILGVKLKEYCLGHYFLMNRFDCAFASDSKDMFAGIIDLLLGIAICSRTYKEFIEFARDDVAFNEWMAKWSEDIQDAIKTDKTFNFLHKTMQFEKYMRDGIGKAPKNFPKDDSASESESGTHWSQALLHVLMAELHYTHDEAITMPLCKAVSEYHIFLESKGLITLRTDDDIANEEAVLAAEAKERSQHGNQ